MDDLKLYGSNKVKVVRILPGDIEMKFGFDKFVVLKEKRGKKVHCEGIDLADGVGIEEAEEEVYKYLWILQMDDICQKKMKAKVQMEYYKRVRAVLKSQLNGGNVINVINISAVVTVRYVAGIIYLNKGQLHNIGRQTRKLLNMHRGLHPHSFF